MRERPILFAGDMVREIRAGGKTQTRRVITPQPDGVIGYIRERETWCFKGDRDCVATHELACPYGIPGDRLWVRETWRTRESLDSMSPSEIADAASEAGFYAGPRCPLKFEADGTTLTWGEQDRHDFGEWGKTRVSIHMPRWASRISLEILEVKVERIRDIGREPADALAEGISLRGDSTAAPFNAVNDFAALWDRINEARGFGWKANPWVWVVKFRRC